MCSMCFFLEAAQREQPNLQKWLDFSKNQWTESCMIILLILVVIHRYYKIHFLLTNKYIYIIISDTWSCFPDPAVIFTMAARIPMSPEHSCSDDEWSRVYGEEQVLSQKDSEEMESACCAKSESGSEHESADSCKFTVWWSRVLYSAVCSLGCEWPAAPNKPVQLVSACTGCSAEASVFKARWGVRFKFRPGLCLKFRVEIKFHEMGLDLL